MPKTPKQEFFEDLFGGFSRGIEQLPETIRADREEERNRRRKNFSDFLNLRELQMSQEKVQAEQQAAEELRGFKQEFDFMGQFAGAFGPEAAGKIPLGGFLSAGRKAGVSLGSAQAEAGALGIGGQEEETGATESLQRIISGGGTAEDILIVGAQPGGATILDKQFADAKAGSPDRQIPTFGQLQGLIKTEIKRQKNVTLGAINRIALKKFEDELPKDNRGQSLGITNITDAEILAAETNDPQIRDLVDKFNRIGTPEHRETMDIGDLIESFQPEKAIKQSPTPRTVVEEIGNSLSKRGKVGLSSSEIDALLKARPELRKYENDIRSTFGIAE